MNLKSMEVVPSGAVAPVFLKLPALMKMEVAPVPAAAMPSKVFSNVAPNRLLITAPFTPVILPALQVAGPELTNLHPFNVVLPLIVSPPLALRSAFETDPPPKVNGPVTVTGLVPPRVPALTPKEAAELAVLKLITPPAPPTSSVVPLTQHPG